MNTAFRLIAIINDTFCKYLIGPLSLIPISSLHDLMYVAAQSDSQRCYQALWSGPKGTLFCPSPPLLVGKLDLLASSAICESLRFSADCAS